ncbi:hypothetical protein RB595_010613 [Gaeumannomyces hyphopodioides]
MVGRASTPSDTPSTGSDSWSIIDGGEPIEHTTAFHAVRYPQQTPVLDFHPSAPAKRCGQMATAVSHHRDIIMPFGGDGCCDIPTPVVPGGLAQTQARSSESDKSSCVYATSGALLSPLVSNASSGGNRPRSHSNPPRPGSESPGAVSKRMFLQELGRRGVAFSEPNPSF